MMSGRDLGMMSISELVSGNSVSTKVIQLMNSLGKHVFMMDIIGLNASFQEFMHV